MILNNSKRTYLAFAVVDCSVVDVIVAAVSFENLDSCLLMVQRNPSKNENDKSISF